MSELAPDTTVRPLGPERHHYWMAQRMAKATGVDLVAAMQEQALTQHDWAQMITRCRGCDWAEGCEYWLSALADGPRDLPESCPNHDRFSELRDCTKGT